MYIDACDLSLWGCFQDSSAFATYVNRLLRDFVAVNAFEGWRERSKEGKRDHSSYLLHNW